MPKFVNPSRYGSINPNNWRKYPDHYTKTFWPASFPHSPRDYGSNEFHGRTHPEIVFVSLERYNSRGDVIWDPMAGSGTVIDVCKELNMECIATDINPMRDDILCKNAVIWRPGEVDGVILHPPYMNAIDYGNESTNLATPDINKYTNLMSDVVDNVIDSLKLNRVCTLIIGSVYIDSQVYSLDCELYPLFTNNFRLLGKIVRPFGETKGGKTAGAKNENLWKYRRLKYGIWELGVDYVMFWQLIDKNKRNV